MKEVKEALKEVGRLVVLSVLPILFAGINVSTGEFSINWKIVLAVAAITILRFIDKLLHEIGKETENSNLIKGITRF